MDAVLIHLPLGTNYLTVKGTALTDIAESTIYVYRVDRTCKYAGMKQGHGFIISIFVEKEL